MDELYLAYLSLLDELSRDLDKLSALAQKKIDAVRRDDLMALDEVMKHEQAMSLSLRGQEQKRQKLTAQLGLEGVRLPGLASHFPDRLQPQAKESAERLHRSYGVYKTASEAARSTLEVNLHEIEKVIASHGGAPAPGVGYAPANVEPPKNMKTDFRA